MFSPKQLSSQSSSRRRSASRHPLTLETLEDRTLLSTSLPLSPTSWTNFGPAPITNGQTPGATPVSGRVTGLATDPNNPSIIYAATAGGGIWETTNATSANPTWTPLTDNVTDSSGNPIPEFMGAVALGVNPSNTSQQVLYAGTGEADNSGDSYYGEGILVSTDGGQTWKLTGQNLFQGMAISRIAVDPQHPTTAYASVSRDDATGTAGVTGVYKTIDGGLTWVDVTAANGKDSVDSWSDVVIDPTTSGSSAVLFAAVGEASGSANNGVYESTNGGSSWTLISGLPSGTSLGRIALTISHPAADTNATVYVSIATSGASSSLSSLQKSSDGGATWTSLTSNLNGDNYLGGQGSYDNVIQASPTNPNLVFAAGQLQNQGPTTFSGGGIVESQDGGLTWTDGTTHPDINTGTAGNNGPHTDYHALAFDASGRIVVGNDGGVWRLDSNDITTPNIAWTDLNTNLETIQYYGVALDPQNDKIAFGASQDNGASMFDDTGAGASAARSWTLVNGGDGGIVRVDPSNDSIVYLTVPRGDDPQLIEESTDGGKTFSPAGTGISLLNPTNFVVPFAIDPNNNSRLLLGTDQVYETAQGGQSPSSITWHPLQSRNFIFPGRINDIAIAPTSSNTIYVTEGSSVYVTTNDGVSWTLVTPAGAAGSATAIAVDPNNSQIAYAVYAFAVGSGSAGHVFETTNGGASWTDVSGNLPDSPVRSVLAVPGTNLVIVGTDVGVYSSTLFNGASTVWARQGSGMPNAQVTDLQSAKINGQIILATGTHGRGLWEMAINSANVTLTDSGPASANEGDVFTYTLTVSNTGPNDAQNVAVTDVVPSGLSVLSATTSQGSFSASGNSVVYSLGTLTLGSTVTMTLTVQAVEDGHLTDTASVSSTTTLSGTTRAATNTGVAEGVIGLSANSLNATEFTPLNNVVVANFSYSNRAEPASAFTATIFWGDGSSSQGVVVQVGSTYQVVGSHTYTAEGNQALTVTVSEDDASASSSAAVSIAEAPLPAGASSLPTTALVFETMDDLFSGALTAGQLNSLAMALYDAELSIALALVNSGVNAALALEVGTIVGENEFLSLAAGQQQSGASLAGAASSLTSFFDLEAVVLLGSLAGG